MTECPCADRNDKEGFHRYRGEPLCPEAVDYARARSRRKYAARQARQGRTVTPMPSRSWVAGSPILIDEVDPL